MKPPDLDAEWGAAKQVLAAAKLLVDYLEAVPTVPKQLSQQLDDAFSELMTLVGRSGVSRDAGDAACSMANWIALCMVAVERPEQLEDE